MKYLYLLLVAAGLVAAQPTTCSTSAVPTLVRDEGLTERVGDIIYTCTAVPNLAVSINLSVQLNVPVTNRLSTGKIITGTVFTVDNGSGAQPVLIEPLLLTPTTLIWENVPLQFSAQGTLLIRIAGIRAEANSQPVGSQIDALLGGELLISPSVLTVGTPELSLYVGYSTNLICEQYGSPLPANTASFQSLIQAGTSFTTTRLTESFVSAFSPKSAPANLNADNGTRFLIKYSGFPQAAQLFVPNVVAGSDALKPTAGGDLGLPASGGSYAPVAGGSLLLGLVVGADSTGAGGYVIYTPGIVGSGAVTFDSTTQLQMVNGAAYAVYEVVDSNPYTLESAQFPTFLGLARNVVQTPVITSESVTYAAISTVGIASTTAPIPRFVAVTPLSDCGIIGDCGASYFPQLTVGTATLQYNLPAGSPGQAQYVTVDNGGAGVLYWTASVSYTNGSGWLTVQTPSGTGNGTVRLDAYPGNLAPGTYQATLTIDAGAAGRRLVAVTLVVAQPTAPVGPQITAVENAATFVTGPVVAGSLATVMGTSFAGKLVTVTFNNVPATIDFSNATQINLLVPASLASQTSAQMVVTVDGVSSAPTTVQLAQFEPGIFTGAVLNQDSTVNSVSNAAAAGSEIYFYATGLSGSGAITAQIGTTPITTLAYAGPAPGFPGVQQINLIVPAGLGAATTELYVCGNGVCSLPVPLTLK